MALRTNIGKLGGFGFLRPNWGVRGSLFAAFAVIAAMAIVISAGAAMVLGHLGRSMVDLSGRDIPRLAASLQLAAQSASLASQGPALLASRSGEALNSSRLIRIPEQRPVQVIDELDPAADLKAGAPILIYLSGGFRSVAPYVPVGDLLRVRHRSVFPGLARLSSIG